MKMFIRRECSRQRPPALPSFIVGVVWPAEDLSMSWDWIWMQLITLVTGMLVDDEDAPTLGQAPQHLA